MTVVLDVSGMRGDDCCERIQKAISARDQDAVVVVMRVAGRVSIDSTLDAEELVATVGRAGYPAALAFQS